MLPSESRLSSRGSMETGARRVRPGSAHTSSTSNGITWRSMMDDFSDPEATGTGRVLGRETPAVDDVAYRAQRKWGRAAK